MPDTRYFLSPMPTLYCYQAFIFFAITPPPSPRLLIAAMLPLLMLLFFAELPLSPPCYAGHCFFDDALMLTLRYFAAVFYADMLPDRMNIGMATVA